MPRTDASRHTTRTAGSSRPCDRRPARDRVGDPRCCSRWGCNSGLERKPAYEAIVGAGRQPSLLSGISDRQLPVDGAVRMPRFRSPAIAQQSPGAVLAASRKRGGTAATDPVLRFAGCARRNGPGACEAAELSLGCFTSAGNEGLGSGRVALGPAGRGGVNSCASRGLRRLCVPSFAGPSGGGERIAGGVCPGRRGAVRSVFVWRLDRSRCLRGPGVGVIGSPRRFMAWPGLSWSSLRSSAWWPWCCLSWAS